MSKRSLKKVSTLIIITSFVLFMGKVVRINECLENGGTWDQSKSTCSAARHDQRITQNGDHQK